MINILRRGDYPGVSGGAHRNHKVLKRDARVSIRGEVGVLTEAEMGAMHLLDGRWSLKPRAAGNYLMLKRRKRPPLQAPRRNQPC